MTLSAQIAKLLGEDALEPALDLAKAQVKSAATDKEARHLYIDLLVLSGDYERADAQCNVAVTFSPEDAMGFALLRNQLRAIAARDAWFEKGAVPEFPQGPSELDMAAMRLGIADRTPERGDAKTALDRLEELRGERPMVWNGREVSDFRDLDDRIPHALEVIMTGGAYLWVDFSKIASVTIEPIVRPRDLAYRRAKLSLIDGASAPVLLPAIYHGTKADPALRLGRETEWVKEPSGISTGRGHRCFLAGDELVSFHETVSLDAAEHVEARKTVHG
ncbi:type VI secretion system accessory protein TagJ [Rhizobium mongolense]|uniref:Type VI secretion system protein ImpE n=1 Tax=Rhizobium mongolense TaxID=57676 RepID=A0A7W6RNP2_9HYPH|nr:type VI secretion system accessory protein TagJ [Rhizobium mongolense]MBB4275612.1 type VI secretion system protein ImpE [Rhizobium mongolense]